MLHSNANIKIYRNTMQCQHRSICRYCSSMKWKFCGKLDFYVDKHSADGVGGQGKGEPGRRPQSVKTQHSSSKLEVMVDSAKYEPSFRVFIWEAIIRQLCSIFNIVHREGGSNPC